jgi:AraC family transcriptional regulator
LAKIAVELEQALARRARDGAPGEATSRVLAQGDGWAVTDVVCTSGPRDRTFEEQHECVSIAIVAAGSFQYRAPCRSGDRRELMTPGSILLGNAGRHFECGHEHGAGDRCLAFRYAPDHFEKLATDAGARGSKLDFPTLRLPPLREMSPLVARACAALAGAGTDGSGDVPWEEFSVQIATHVVRLAHGLTPEPVDASPSAVARVTRAVRMIERQPDAELTLSSLAREAGLSPYHFLRIFERLTGVTPHQYVLRARLREAAMRLATERAKVLDVAFDCGFGDVSNFNRNFRAEFGVNPRAFRAPAGASSSPRLY